MSTITIPVFLGNIIGVAEKAATSVADACEYATAHAIGYATDVNSAEGDRVVHLVMAAARLAAEAAEALNDAAEILGL